MKITSLFKRFANVGPVVGFFLPMVWKQERIWLLGLALEGALNGLFPLVNVVFTKMIIDELVGQKRLTELAWILGGLVLSNLVLGLATTIIHSLKQRCDTRMAMFLDRLMGRKTMTMDFENTERPEVLDRLQLAKTGMDWYSGGIRGLADRFKDLLSATVTLSGSVAILASLSPWLLLLLAGVVGLKLVFTNWNARMEAGYQKQLVGINRRFGCYFGLLSDFSLAKDVRLYKAMPMVVSRAEDYMTSNWRVNDEMIKKQHLARLGSLTGDLIQQLGLYLWLGFQVFAGAITLGQFQMLLGGAGNFAGSLNWLMWLLVDLAKASDFMVEYKNFLEIPDRQGVEGLPVPQGIRHRFEFQDVWFAYPGAAEGAWALKGINLVLEQGERLSVVGENGAGKTTLVKLLCRLYDPAKGRILLDGVDVRDYALTEYWKLFGVVFQDFRFFAFTVRENLACPETGQPLDAVIAVAAEKVGILDRIKELPKGFDTPLQKGFEEDGVELSGGETQKLAIARALVKDGPVAILDEPTAALDPLAEYEIYQHFDHLIGGKTAIYISHRLSSCRICDRIAVFHSGELVEYGHFEDLAEKPEGIFARLWAAQSQFYLGAKT